MSLFKTFSKACIWRIRGQSNTGASTISSIPAGSGLRPTLNGVLVANLQNGGWETLQLGVNNSAFPNQYWINYGPDVRTNLYGWCYRLMQLSVDYYQRKHYLYQYGWGNSGLGVVGSGKQWLPSVGGIYTEANSSFTGFKNNLKLVDPAPNVDIWIQGETDILNGGADSTSVVASYSANLATIIAADRAFLGKIIPFIIISVSTNQVYPSNSGQVANMRAQQKSLAQYVYNLDGSTTIQSGGSVIQNVHYIEQNGTCENQGGSYLHYDYTSNESTANKIFSVVKKYKMFN